MPWLISVFSIVLLISVLIKHHQSRSQIAFRQRRLQELAAYDGYRLAHRHILAQGRAADTDGESLQRFISGLSQDFHHLTEDQYLEQQAEQYLDLHGEVAPHRNPDTKAEIRTPAYTPHPVTPIVSAPHSEPTCTS